jgi:hypothetical protein
MIIIKKSVISKSAIMIVLAVAFCVPFQTYSEAKAGPVGLQASSTGGVPLLSFSGQITIVGSETIYTVPADRVFILTGAYGNSGATYMYWDIYENSTEKVSRYLLTNSRPNTGTQLCHALCSNQARIPFSSGSQIKLQSYEAGGYYMIHGYLANAN